MRVDLAYSEAFGQAAAVQTQAAEQKQDGLRHPLIDSGLRVIEPFAGIVTFEQPESSPSVTVHEGVGPGAASNSTMS